MQRITYVDGLRAVAVLAVVLHHAATNAAGLPGWAAHVLLEGAHGVDLFFVLSGFCLAYPTLLKLRTTGAATFDLVGYAAKRLVRIAPPYYAALVLLAIALHAPLLQVLKQALFLDRDTVFVNGSFWTLAVELRWYVVFPLLLTLWLRSPRAFASVGLAAAAGYAFTRAHSIDLGTLPAFMLGIVAADVQVRQLPIRRYAWPLLGMAVPVALALEPLAAMPSPVGNADHYSFFVQTQLGWQVAAFAFVVLIGTSARARRLVSVAPLVATGLASYSIYLVHEPLVAALERHYQGIFGAGGAFAIATIGALASGFVFWRAVEFAFTSTPIKRRLVAALKAPASSLLRLAGVAPTLRLEAARPGQRFATTSAPMETVA